MKGNVVIVGGGPAGFNAARAVKVFYPECKVTLIEERENTQIPCSIPSVVAGRLPLEKNLYSLKKLRELGVEIETCKAEVLDTRERKLFLENGKTVFYDKLVLATGWRPKVPSVDEGNLEGIYYVSKTTEQVRKISEEVKSAKRILLVGGGLIGIGFAGEIKRALKSKDVFLVEVSKRLASGIFSPSFSEKLEEELTALGVRVLKETTVRFFEGDTRVRRVFLSSGDVLDVDVVIIAIGFRPRVELAQEAGIRLTKSGKIAVDEFLRTSADGVFAAGNCRVYTSVIDGEEVNAMLASISARDGYMAGINLGEPVVKDKGIVPFGITSVGDSYFGFAGYTEEVLKKKGKKFISTEVETRDGYPPALEGANPLKVRLYFDESGKIVGGEVWGRSKYVSGLVDFISRLIYEKLSVEEVISVQSVAFPSVTPSPLAQPVQMAALMAKKSL
ncbi:NAD(P)/FAD-dependent oxidoreductase [Phorcysia thermohydrogeniphila]|uniref:NADH oxidase n=1 Tax=Phorcysia thermohydrogeniphila TaxID=936138 RepID=A0A2R4RN38_9BACT|nr:FAD-dependent oxidoreductase [Phorcysia thermohydrogeniphila]AVZ23984.1 NADH oxidase [Phorcysia thermohydrogeniphila]TCK03384.1 NADPH-dependent 2,4-dienoyl-CoA reductase/sulfur reductase-like enzyme [Phorcysia thermohydrogeniphila]